MSTITAQAVAMELDSVTFGYAGDAAVVRDVSVSLPAGRVCALIGPNAAGKSTLLRLMLGQLSPWRGSVRVDGLDVAALPPARRAATVSYVPQRSSASFAFDVEQVVRMGRHALPPDAAAIAEAMGESDLHALRHRAFNELSAGQQQRVLVARAIAQAGGERRCTGRVMLLDEPSSAMDLWHVHRLMDTLRRLAGAGLAVLVVLHDLNLAARYADEVWLMHEGTLAAAGPWEGVLRPAVLEPIYRVGLRAITHTAGDRPVFFVEPGGKIRG